MKNKFFKLAVLGLLFSTLHGQAQGDYPPLNVWSFQDTTNWTSDYGTAPVSFSNLDFAYLGNGSSLVVNTDAPAWLQFNVTEASGTTNLTLDIGTVRFWFAPSWSGTNVGGVGPGVAARLVEVGGFTEDSSLGWWSLYTDEAGANLFFSAQTNEFASNVVTYLSVPIAWTTNYFHNVALTYSPTNTALYLDGELVTNGLPLTVFPAGDVLTNGFFIGSDRDGMNQAHGLFSQLATYAEPLDAATIQQLFDADLSYYEINPNNTVMFLNSAHAANSIATTNDLWLQFSKGSSNSAFLVIHIPWNTSGPNYIYDVFATTNLMRNVPGLNLTNWTLVTRSAPGQTNLTFPRLAGASVGFYRLGTVQDSDGDGLTDAYENLVSHTSSSLWDSNGNGISDGDEISPSGLPWRLEAVRKWAAVIYANAPTATQGGVCGQATVYLPQPAPTGGTLVQYLLGGTAVLNADFTLLPVSNQLLIPAGSSSGTISLCAASGSTYSAIKLYADVTLTNAATFPVDSTPARINFFDTGLPSIRVFALPSWVRRPSATYGTNAVGFYFIRGGTATNALTVGLTTTGGSAVSGLDYTALPATVAFAANVRTNWLPLTILPNSTNPADKTLVLTISSAPGYVIDPTNGVARVTIAATAAPVLPVVQVTATDVDATTNSPGQFTFTRSFATANALRVYYHAWTATSNVFNSVNSLDTAVYAALPGFVDIPANATNVNVPLVVSNPPALVVPVILTLAQGEYTIGNNNQDTVYIDGSGTPSFTATVTRTGIYGATVSQAAEIQLVRYGSALSAATVNWSITNQYIGPTIQGVRAGQFVWAAHQSVTTVALYTQWSAWPDSWQLPTLTLSNAWNFRTVTLPYNPPSAMFSVFSSASPALTVPQGSTVATAISVSRLHPNSSPLTLNLTLSGSAANGTDYSMSSAVNFAANQSLVTLPFQAFANTVGKGWKTVVVAISSGGLSSQVGQTGSDRTFVRIQDPQNLLSDTDLDGDGLPDGYELNNQASGFDLLTPNDPYQDADRDGVGLLEELEIGSDPNTTDAPPVYPSIEPSDFVPLTLRVGALGKMLTEPGETCAVCHAVTLRAGNFIRSSSATDWTHNPTTADYLLRLPRGTNYPVQVFGNPYYSSLLPSNQVPTNSHPHYTAAYVAQFLADTNGGVWPFIVDTNRLLGTNLPLVQEVLPKRATLYIPDLMIAADVDRSGVIDFQSRNDRTFATNPFVFWINDDVDSGSDDTAGDLDPTTNPLNSTNNTIDGLRDLEDFARLQFKIEGLPVQFLTNGNYQVKVYLTNLLGAPSLRLFPAAETNGGLGYLTNLTTANNQIAKAMLGVVTNGLPLTIAGTNWLAAGTNSFFLPLIFEGISTGQCVVTFGFSTNNQPPVALSRPFYLTLQKVTSLYEHWTAGDNTNTDWTQIPNYPARTLDSGIYPAPQRPEDMDYIVFVHGWRMLPWERRAFASTGYKRLWHLGYKGRYELYSWPTDYTGTTLWDMTSLVNRQNYDRSEQRAWESGTGLYGLLANLNEAEPPLKVRVIAHSMGNIVVSEGLRLAGTYSSGQPLIQTYIASQAASVAHAYDATNPEIVRTAFKPEIYAHFPRNATNQPYFTGMKKAVQGTNIFNFHNKDDYALNATISWPLNQFTKPDWGWRYQLVATNSVNTNGSYTYWETNGLRLYLENPDQAHTIYSYIAMAWSKALGCSEDPIHQVRGEIGGGVNLNLAPFNYTAATYEHSAEFNSINMNRRSYWWQVLSTFSLTNNLPQP